MAQVRLQGITRRFDNTIAVEEITFAVPDGQFWVLVGPSGCGKSTILRTIAGLETATEGNLYIGNTLVNTVPARQRDVAMVFQNYALYPHMTVADNLAFGLRMRKTDDKIIAQRLETVARSLNIAHLLQRKPAQLSGGQQQRVALGRAIARQPQVFLLDEPLSNLDAQLRDDTRAELKQLHERVGITTIYVTHDQIEAMTLAERVVVLDWGRVQQIGAPQEIYAHPANRMVATFLGNPPMNIIPVTYLDDSFTFNHQSLPVPSPMRQQLGLQPGQGFALGIRPEAVAPALEESDGQLTMEIDVVEPLGRETLIRGKLPQSEIAFNCIAPASWRGQRGDRLGVRINSECLFLFDANSGKTLYP
ncbi:MAG: ABC transporter ATP-binding protein [Cyanophyceae cyanobacterium]